MDTISELGTDIRSGWNFKDGDLTLVTNDENLVQATNNRLNTREDSLIEFYDSYGSILHHFHGWKKNETTLKFMRLELEKVLKQDPRFKNFNTSLEYNTEGRVDITIQVYFDDSTTVEMNYTIGENGTIEEY